MCPVLQRLTRYAAAIPLELDITLRVCDDRARILYYAGNVQSQSTGQVKGHGHIIRCHGARVTDCHRYQDCVWRCCGTVHLLYITKVVVYNTGGYI